MLSASNRLFLEQQLDTVLIFSKSKQIDKIELSNVRCKAGPVTVSITPILWSHRTSTNVFQLHFVPII